MTSLSRSTVTLLMPCLAVCGGWWVTLAASQGASYTDQTVSVPWVRTNDGWEKAYWLLDEQSSFVPPIHPAIVTGLLIVTAATILMISDRRQRKTSLGGVVGEIAIDRGDRL